MEKDLLPITDFKLGCSKFHRQQIFDGRKLIQNSRTRKMTKYFLQLV
jgi:hypothetical protein